MRSYFGGPGKVQILDIGAIQRSQKPAGRQGGVWGGVFLSSMLPQPFSSLTQPSALCLFCPLRVFTLSFLLAMLCFPSLPVSSLSPQASSTLHCFHLAVVLEMGTSFPYSLEPSLLQVLLHPAPLLDTLLETRPSPQASLGCSWDPQVGGHLPSPGRTPFPTLHPTQTHPLPLRTPFFWSSQGRSITS